jgi:hypothetical protein
MRPDGYRPERLPVVAHPDGEDAGRQARNLQSARRTTTRDHISVYLFAMLLPFYSEAIDTWRDLGATFAARAFIVFLFWHLNLHYMNLLFRGARLPRLYRLSAGRRQRAYGKAARPSSPAA